MCGAWFLPHRGNDIDAIRKWCEENLTEGTWSISSATMGVGVYDVCVGIEDEAMAFKLRWL